MAFSTREVYLISEDLRQCVMTELEHTVGGVPPGFDSCVTPGSITWDNCCPGMMRVSWSRQYATDRFPDPVIRPAPCGAYERSTDIQLAILRCAPGPDQDGHPPLCEALDRAAQVLAEDADALWRGVRCCLQGTMFDFVVREVVPLGPRGQCVGVQMTLTIGLADSCMCHG